jgi:hypothetical protein
MLDSNNLLDSMGGIHQNDILEAGQMLGYIDAPREKHVKLKSWSTVLIAALLAVLLTACGWVCYKYYMSSNVPNDTIQYHYAYYGKDDDVSLNPAIVVSFDVDQEAVDNATEILLRCNWVPDNLNVDYDKSYLESFSYLDDNSMEKVYPDEKLSEAGFTREEAELWHTRLEWYTDNGELLQVHTFNAADLYKRDLLLGMYGGEATVVNQGIYGKYEMQEIQVDLTNTYKSIYEERFGMDYELYMPLDSKLHENYLLLFDPDEQYLLYVGGNSTAFTFETLEKIADNTEIKITNLHTEPTYENQDYIVGGLARG